MRPSAPPPPPSPPRGRRLRAVAPERRDPYSEERPTQLRKSPESLPDLEPETHARTPLPGYQSDPLGAPFDSLPSLEVRRPFDSFEAEFAERDPETQVAAAAALHKRKREGSGPRMRPAEHEPETNRRDPYPDPYTDPYAREAAPAPASYADPYKYEAADPYAERAEPVARDPYDPPAPKARRRDRPISQERARDDQGYETRHERRDSEPRRGPSAAPAPAPAPAPA
ncbi:MAG: hypothetical protein KC657_23560, partial [Myxococcales bacterium]|nr:hypothetical protein [Myxococcales bacterium]